MPIQNIAPGIGIELMYSFIIILFSLAIYFVTKELYELSSHKGIRYFRQAFLFFALAYFFRSFIKILLHYFKGFEILDISSALWIISRSALFIFMYFSSMAIFYLLYSVIWKDGNKNKIYLFHLLALLISVISILTKHILVRLGIHVLLLFFVIYLVYYSYSNKKNKNLSAIYVLLLFFWILNILDILIPNFLRAFQLILYAASLAVFFFIFYKVIKIMRR